MSTTLKHWSAYPISMGYENIKNIATIIIIKKTSFV